MMIINKQLCRPLTRIIVIQRQYVNMYKYSPLTIVYTFISAREWYC